VATCPQCNKPLAELTRQCPSCRADLDLLVDYVNGLNGKLERATQLTRAGELGQAVWAYLEVLETDPDNPTARQQIGQIANAVRQFDRTAPGRRWALGKAIHGGRDGSGLSRWVKGWLVALALVTAFLAGVACGARLYGDNPPTEDQGTTGSNGGLLGP
jgi:hypothetical protein